MMEATLRGVAQGCNRSMGHSPQGFGPPVSYGTVPPGAVQVLPLGGGAPPPLASGDFITVFLTAPDDDGYTEVGQGSTIVP